MVRFKLIVILKAVGLLLVQRIHNWNNKRDYFRKIQAIVKLVLLCQYVTRMAAKCNKSGFVFLLLMLVHSFFKLLSSHFFSKIAIIHFWKLL